jgi:hypothetical protein
MTTTSSILTSCRLDQYGSEIARRYISTSGSEARSFFSSGTPVIVASVSRSTLATETAFSSATRTTLLDR